MIAQALAVAHPRHLAYLALALALLFAWPGVFPLDDGYITLHNARSLLAGGDSTYGGSALTGATSIVHLALLAMTSRGRSAGGPAGEVTVGQVTAGQVTAGQVDGA